MSSPVRKYIEKMTENELKDMLKRDYLRRLLRYKKSNEFYEKKYGMNYDKFISKNIIKKQNFSFEVETDSQEWELALDGIETISKKLKELAGGI